MFEGLADEIRGGTTTAAPKKALPKATGGGIFAGLADEIKTKTVQPVTPPPTITPTPQAPVTSAPTTQTGPSKTPMVFTVGEGLKNTTDVLPGPRISTLNALQRGEQINVTPKPVQQSEVTKAKVAVGIDPTRSATHTVADVSGIGKGYGALAKVAKGQPLPTKEVSYGNAEGIEKVGFKAEDAFAPFIDPNKNIAVKIIQKPVGAVVKTAGNVIGGTVGAAGNVASTMLQGKGADAYNSPEARKKFWKDVVDTARSTGNFGQDIGEQGAAMAPIAAVAELPGAIGAAGSAINAISVIPQVSQVYSDIQNGHITMETGINAAMALMFAHGAVKNLPEFAGSLRANSDVNSVVLSAADKLGVEIKKDAMGRMRAIDETTLKQAYEETANRGTADPHQIETAKQILEDHQKLSVTQFKEKYQKPLLQIADLVDEVAKESIAKTTPTEPQKFVEKNGEMVPIEPVVEQVATAAQEPVDTQNSRISFKPDDPLHNRIMDELVGAQAGKRFAIEDQSSPTGLRFTGTKSTFPDWIPEDLRRKPLLDSVSKHIFENTMPTKAAEIRLYNVVADEMNANSEVLNDAKFIEQQRNNLYDPFATKEENAAALAKFDQEYAKLKENQPGSAQTSGAENQGVGEPIQTQTPSGEKSQQPGGSLEANFAHAKEAKPELVKLSEDLAKKYGGDVHVGPDKLPERIKQKAESDYGGNTNRTLDYIRTTVEVSSPDHIKSAIADLQKHQAPGREIKNLFDKPTDLGYVGVISNPVLSNGHIGEIQVSVPEVLKFKNERGRDIKRILDDLKSKAREEKRGLTPEEKQLKEKLTAESIKGYQTALSDATSRLNSSAEISRRPYASVMRKPAALGDLKTSSFHEPSANDVSRVSTESSPRSASGWSNEKNLTDSIDVGANGVTSPSTLKIPEKVEIVKTTHHETELHSRVYERLQAEEPSLSDSVTYKEHNLKENARKAVELIASDKEKAYRIAMGAEDVPEGQTATAVNIALAEKALSEGNTDLYAQLVKNRSLEQTRRGQELVAEKGSISDNSTSRYVKELIKTRLDKLGNSFLGNLSKDMLKKTKGSKAIDVIDREVKKVKERIRTVKELDLAEAQSFLDSLACK